MKWIDAGIGAVIASTLPILVGISVCLMQIKLTAVNPGAGFLGVNLIMVRRVTEQA